LIFKISDSQKGYNSYQKISVDSDNQKRFEFSERVEGVGVATGD